MTRVDLLITGGNIVSPDGIQELNVGITDGKIFSLTRYGEDIEHKTEIKAEGKYLLPGCVDAHVHPRDPGFTYKEDFTTLTKAAAVGGVTTIMCQPTTNPSISNSDMFNRVFQHWRGKALVDFAIQGMAEPDNIHDIGGLIEAGVVSLEFLGKESTGSMFKELLIAVSSHGGIAGLSSEDIHQFLKKGAEFKAAGRNDILAWIEALDAGIEAYNVSRSLDLTKETSCAAHLHMISTRKSVELIRNSKSMDRNVITAETSPKYLMLTQDDHVGMGPFSTVLPRFKTADDNEALWEGILDNTIDMIATDHAPHARHEKEKGFSDIWMSPTGVPEVELSLPLMLTQVNKGRLSINKLVDLMCETPARTYKIYPQKGVIQVGADADVVVTDMNSRRVVKDSMLITAPKYSAFDGFDLIGGPIVTIVRGNLVMKLGEIAMGEPIGNIVRPNH